MDPLKKAVARKGWDKSGWTRDDRGPVLSINIGGPVSGEPEEPEMEGPEAYGDDDGPLSPTELDMPDDAPEAELEAARAKFRQKGMDAGEDPVDVGEKWTDPYSEPDAGEAAKDDEYVAANREQVLSDFGFSDEEVEDYASQLSESGVDPAKVGLTYLRSEFGLTSTEAQALREQLRGGK